MRTTISLSSVAVGLAALLATPAVASAQTFYAVSGGLEATYPRLGYFTIQGSVGGRISPGFEARVEAFVSHWDSHWDEPFYCPPHDCFPPASSTTPGASADWRGMDSFTSRPPSMARGRT